MEQQAGAVILVAVIVGGVVMVVQAVVNAFLIWMHLGKPRILPASMTASSSSKTVTVKPAAFHTGTGPVRVEPNAE